MSRIKEYIGRRSIEAVNYDGKGNNLYNQWLTDHEVIRCRDCEHSVCTNGDWICRLFYRLYGDPVYIESWRMHETQPDGFCAWAERRSGQ